MIKKLILLSILLWITPALVSASCSISNDDSLSCTNLPTFQSYYYSDYLDKNENVGNWGSSGSHGELTEYSVELVNVESGSLPTTTEPVWLHFYEENDWTGLSYTQELTRTGVGVWEIGSSTTYTITTGASRIVSVVPEHSEATSSPITISVRYFIAEGDENTEIRINFQQLTNVLGELPYVFDTFLVDSTGDQTYSTTTSMSDGSYEIMVEMMETFAGLPILGARDRVSHLFSVGTSTVWADAVIQLADAFESYSTTTASWTWSQCVQSLPQCFRDLWIPTPNQFVALKNAFDDDVMKKPPLGYVRAIFVDITSSSTQPLENLVMTVPEGLPMGGTEFEVLNWYDDFGTTSMLGTYTATSSDETFWDITMPYFNTIIYLLLGMSIFFTVLRFR